MTAIPAYVDMARLCREVSLCESTVETCVKRGELPPPIHREGKRLWNEIGAAAEAVRLVSELEHVDKDWWIKLARAALEAAEQVREPQLEKRPVAWRVNHADHCMIFQDEAAAYKEHEVTGAPMHGLYVRDGQRVDKGNKAE
jgi:hypothetical protein